MGNASRTVRSHLTAGGAVAGAGILAFGLVIATPDPHGARAEVRPVQLASVALPPSAYLGALEKFIGNQVAAVVPVAAASKDGPSDIAPLGGSTVDPAVDPQQSQATALAATTAGSGPGAILGSLASNTILGPILFIGGFAFIFLVAVPVLAFVEIAYEALASVFGGILGLPPTLPLAGPSAASAAAAPTLTTDAVLRESVAAGPDESSDGASTGDFKKADESLRPASKKRATGDERTSKQDERSADQPSAGEPASESAKPPERLKTPRSVVRDSLDASDRQPGPPHHDKTGRPNKKGETADAASANSGSSDDDSSNGDAGDSN